MISPPFFRTQALYCPPLDTSLVAAIASDEGQTLQSAKEVLSVLAASAGDSSSSSFSYQLNEVSSSSSSSPRSSPRAAKPSSISPKDSSKSPSLLSPNDASSAGTGDGSTSETVEQLLEEFHLTEKLDAAAAKADHLNLTDEEEGSDVEGSSSATSDAPVKDFPPYDETKQDSQFLEGEQDPVSFLCRAFPTRTRDFLVETLEDCRGDVGTTIDTIMTIDLVQREELEATIASEMPSASSSTSTSKRGGGLDYDALANGASHLKGKKGRAQRRKAHEEHLRAMGQEVKSSSKPSRTKVTLGDVRQGGRDVRPTSKSSSNSSLQPETAALCIDAEGLTDFELARRLANMEADPMAGEAVKDNQWVLTSSVLSQLSTLLDLEPQEVTSAYNKAGFNLHIAVGRLVDSAASQYPSLSSLEDFGADSAPQGTAQAIVDSITSLSGKNPELVSLCLRATKGRQDATLDLLNLMDVVKDAAGGEKPDQLDPLGKLRGEVGEDARRKPKEPPRTVESSQTGISVDFAQQDPLPGESSRLDPRSLDAAKRAGGFSRAAVAGRNTEPTGQGKAMASLRQGDQTTVSFPPSAGQVNNTSLPIATQLMHSRGTSSSSSTPSSSSISNMSIAQRDAALDHFRSLATEYQNRRNRCLLQASSAWRSSPNNRGAAFYYADEARRLEAKSRAWNLKAAELLVEQRKRPDYSGGRHSDHSSRNGVVLDLHGVTVREALSIVGDELNAWWSRPIGDRKGSLTIITGAGRHSPNQVAILTPSVARYLTKEGWKAEVDRNRGVIVVRGR